jgi:protein TonB
MSKKRTQRRLISRLGGAVFALLLIASFIWFVRTMMLSKSSKPERQVQVVQIIKPPPPPPPDQPPPPPPEKTEEPLPQDQPEPTPSDEPPPNEPMGLDAEGSAGGDAFGLAARRGGSDLIGGNGSAAFAWYTNRLKDAVIDRLASDPSLGSKKFSISVRVWIAADGRVQQVKLATTTGNAEIDQRIERALSTLSGLSDAPPLEMPQPVSLKIVSRK